MIIMSLYTGRLPGEGSRGTHRATTRKFQLQQWSWDVFICHPGEDKPFAILLHRRLQQLGLRSYLDKESLSAGSAAPHLLEAAVKSTQIAVVLLSEEFFVREWPQRELRWYLDAHSERKHLLIPVYLGLTNKRCGPESCKLL